MAHPDGYELRAPRRDEAGQVADLFAAATIGDPCEPTLGEGFFLDKWGLSTFDLATDAWLFTDATGDVVAYGQVLLEGPSVFGALGVVHPDHCSRGLGSRLLELIEARATELTARPSAARLRHGIDAHDRVAAGMLRERGMQCVRHFWHMQTRFLEPPAPPPRPAGVEIRPIDVDTDLPVVHRLLTTAFMDHWGHHADPYEEWVRDNTGSPTFDPTLWLLATADGGPAGALTADADGDVGWVGEIGVLADHRGRGIGAALLREAFATLHGRGVRVVNLNVDSENSTGAVGLYTRVGMQPVMSWDMWEGSVGPSG